MDAPTRTTVVHDTVLLSEPCLTAPAMVYLPAGTTLAPRTYVQGFYAVAYHHQEGFLPAALCTPHALPPHHPRMAIVTQPIELWGTRDATHPCGRSPLAADALVQILGHDASAVLVQCADGRSGFLPTSACRAIPMQDDPRRWPLLRAYVWLSLGAGWCGGNIWGGQLLMQYAGVGTPHFHIVALALLGVGLVGLVKWNRHPRYLVFLLGCLLSWGGTTGVLIRALT